MEHFVICVTIGIATWSGKEMTSLPPACVVYTHCVANSKWLQTGYDQPIIHLMGGADHAIRAGRLPRGGRSLHPADPPSSRAVASPQGSLDHGCTRPNPAPVHAVAVILC